MLCSHPKKHSAACYFSTWLNCIHYCLRQSSPESPLPAIGRKPPATLRRIRWSEFGGKQKQTCDLLLYFLSLLRHTRNIKNHLKIILRDSKNHLEISWSWEILSTNVGYETLKLHIDIGYRSCPDLSNPMGVIKDQKGSPFKNTGPNVDVL